MADERRVHPEYAEDVDVMILEYLIHNSIKACFNDFNARTGTDLTAQPSENMMTQLQILDDFLRTRQAQNQAQILGEEASLWLELLGFLVLATYRRTDFPPVFSFTDPARSAISAASQSKNAERRCHWLSMREETSQVTDWERTVYKSWQDVGEASSSLIGDGSRDPVTLKNMCPFFLTLSARIFGFIKQTIGETWVELAAQFMLQAALEAYLTPSLADDKNNQVAQAFAWGWIPPERWERDYGWTDQSGADLELMANKIFADEDSRLAGENQLWQETRLKYLSFFDISKQQQHGEPLSHQQLKTLLGSLARENPVEALEVKMMDVLEQMWSLCRKPVLIQIEEGHLDGLSSDEFDDFKERVLLPH